MEKYSQFSSQMYTSLQQLNVCTYSSSITCTLQIICYMPDSQGFLEIAEVFLYYSDLSNRNYLHFCFVVGVISHTVLDE